MQVEVMEAWKKECEKNGWVFCEVLPIDDPTNQFPLGTTKYTLTVAGDPEIANWETFSGGPPAPVIQFFWPQPQFCPNGRCGSS